LRATKLHPETEVTDRAYETILMVYRMAAPETGRWLQTRETFALNLRNLLDGDVYTYRCGEVRPGGYHRGNGDAPVARDGQFGVNELERGIRRARTRCPELSHRLRLDREPLSARGARQFDIERRIRVVTQRRIVGIVKRSRDLEQVRRGIMTKSSASPGQSSRRRSS